MATRTAPERISQSPEARRRSTPSPSVPGMDIFRGSVFKLVSAAPAKPVGNEAPRVSDQINVDKAITELLMSA